MFLFHLKKLLIELFLFPVENNGGRQFNFARKRGEKNIETGIYNGDYEVYGDNLVNSISFIFW